MNVIMRDSFDLPSDYFAKLPRDLRLDEMIVFCSSMMLHLTYQTDLFLRRKLLSASMPNATEELPNVETMTFKQFGELQVELSPEKAYTGAVIAVVFGFLSWGVSQGIQNIPESSLQYANDNALLLAKSLRGALLAASYMSALLSGFSAIGLVLLARELQSKDKLEYVSCSSRF